MKRSEMNQAYCWNLGDIFADNEAWECAFAKASERVKQIPALAGSLGASAEALKSGLDLLFSVMRDVELVYVYASLYASGDNGDPTAQDMEARATSLIVEMSTAAAFLNPEILAIDEEKLSLWMQGDDMQVYRHMIENICRARKHTLTQSEERLLAMLGDAAMTPKRSFEMFESVDMRFPALEDGRELTHALFGAYREDKDAQIRGEAFEKYFGEFAKHINTLASLYSGSVKFDSFYARAHKHESALAAGLFENNVPTKLYENLLTCVHAAIPTLEKYLEMRRTLLGMDELRLYDLYVPLVEDVDAVLSYEQAQQMVLEACKPLGEEYQKLLQRAFDEKWIDVYENEGKTTGAFSCGVYGVHPYVLLNFTGKYDDAFTLAHELGHSMHSWFSSQTQEYVNNEYAIFVAEVASTVNEVLLTRYLLEKETDKRMRAYILNHLLEGFRTTVFRQTLFAEFEKRSHEMYEKGAPLTPQSLNAVYRELNETYYPICKGSPESDAEWARIPHFYRAFYVYQYATGFCSAVAIADRILKEHDAQQYIRFLSTGGSMYPIDELKLAGVDLSSSTPIERALNVFKDSFEEFEQLMREL